MEIITLSDRTLSPAALFAVAAAIGKSKVVALPTDTVYGLAAAADSPRAIKRIFALKKRPEHKPLPVLVNSLAMAKTVGHINAANERLLQSFWPAPISVILFKRDATLSELTAGGSTVMVRWPNDPLLHKVITAVGKPITGTSANISGEDSFVDGTLLIERFAREKLQPDIVVCATTEQRQNTPSTIIDLTGARPKILRVGMTDRETLSTLLLLAGQ